METRRTRGTDDPALLDLVKEGKLPPGDSIIYVNSEGIIECAVFPVLPQARTEIEHDITDLLVNEMPKRRAKELAKQIATIFSEFGYPMK